jgi:hypothetical protein
MTVIGPDRELLGASVTEMMTAGMVLGPDSPCDPCDLRRIWQ